MNKTFSFLAFLSILFPLITSAHIINSNVNLNSDRNVDVFISQKSNELLIELAAPSADLVGYEYKPRTTAQKIEFNRVMTILKNPRTFFAVNAEAGCPIDRTPNSQLSGCY